MSKKATKARPGRIAEAKAALDEIEAEITDLENRVLRNRAELAQLSSQLSQRDVDSVARADALRTVIDNLQRDLPVENWQPGDRRPLLQARFDRAEAELKETYRMRAHLELLLLDSEIQRLEWGDLSPSEVESQIARMLVVFERIGFPVGTNERTWRSCLAMMHQAQRDMDESPHWRAALADYGPDPEFADGAQWTRARAELARECLDYGKIESMRNRLQRARGLVFYQTPAELERLSELERWLERLENGQFFEVAQ